MELEFSLEYEDQCECFLCCPNGHCECVDCDEPCPQDCIDEMNS